MPYFEASLFLAKTSINPVQNCEFHWISPGTGTYGKHPIHNCKSRLILLASGFAHMLLHVTIDSL